MTGHPLSLRLTLFVLSAALFPCSSALAAGPLLNVEGVAGGGLVPCAYLPPAPAEGSGIGRPVMAQWIVNGRDTHIYSSSIALNLLDRFEAGIAHVMLDFNRIKSDIEHKSHGQVRPRENAMHLTVVHLKTLLVREAPARPALALTAEYKYNHTIEKIDENVMGALTAIGYQNCWGVDLDVTLSKTLPDLLWWPLLVHANLRLTRAAQIGLLGFCDHYSAHLEAAASLVLRPNLLVGAEFRQKPDPYHSLSSSLPGFSMREDDSWDLNIAWNPIPRLTLAAAYLCYGNAANHKRDYCVFCATWEF